MGESERKRLVSDSPVYNESPGHPAYQHISYNHSQVISHAAFRVSPVRWYILFAFCYMGIIQCFIGNSWGPISSVMKKEFNWSDKKTGLVVLWTSLTFLPGAVLFPVVMAKFQMRKVILANGFLMALAGTIKILSVTLIPLDYLIYTAHLTQIINGFCGAVPMSAIMYIAVNWFPTNERVMACGFVMASLNTGIAIPFLVGPLLVPEPESNTTLAYYGARPWDIVSSVTQDMDKDFYIHRLRDYLSLQGGLMILAFLLVLMYFPDKPKYAPTASAVTARLNVKQGLAILFKRPNFWIIVFVYALSSGAFNGFGLIMDTILSKSGIAQATAGYMGFAALLSSVPSNIILGVLGSVYSHRQKLINCLGLGIGTACMSVVVVMLMGVLELNYTLLWITLVTGTALITGVVPILFDMSTESSHPVSEDLSATFMVVGNQIMCDLFIAMLQIQFDHSYLTWVLLACFVSSVVLAMLYHPTNTRLQIDAHSITIEQLDNRSIHQIRNAGAFPAII